MELEEPKISKAQLLALRRKELEKVKKQKELEEILPHLYVPMYPWQREIHESTNRVNLLTAANQIGKSSALIRRAIANCTDPTRWEKLWGKGVTPRQFWYFYPDGSTLSKEIEQKWVPEWLPRGRMEGDPKYGWRLAKKGANYHALHFHLGTTIYFQMYTKSVSSVQAGSVYELFADEELPMPFYDELMFRLTATSGIFTSGFTPTLNQLFWKQAMEGSKILPHALKMSVSMYDCLQYEDRTPSRIMNIHKIREAESRCKNETERQRRVFGRFVTESGRTYYAFEFDRNMVTPYSIKGWYIYASVDYGSGFDGETAHIKLSKKKNHPSAIVFIAVRPDYKKGAVFKCWRGDNVKTTAGDIFNKYLELTKDLNITQACYDPGAVDFGTIAERNSVSFTKANKAREAGEDLVNTLFKHRILDIFDDDAENIKLAGELSHIMISAQQGEGKRNDDLADSNRYCCMQIPWDLSVVTEKIQENIRDGNKVDEDKPRPMTEAEFQAAQIKMRRGEDVSKARHKEDNWEELDEEIEEWNEEYGNF